MYDIFGSLLLQLAKLTVQVVVENHVGMVESLENFLSFRGDGTYAVSFNKVIPSLFIALVSICFLFHAEIKDAVNECKDKHPECSKLSALGYCQRNHTKMLSECAISCESCDDINYTESSIGCPNKYPSCQDCKDKKDEKICQTLKSIGHCESSPGDMITHCANTCKYCHLQHNYSLRCPLNKDQLSQTQIFSNPGDLNAFFQNIVDYYDNHDNMEWDLEILSEDPWILRLDNFFNETEANGIIDAAGAFQRSQTDIGQVCYS